MLMGVRALRDKEPCWGHTRFTPNTHARFDGLILLMMLSSDTCGGAEGWVGRERGMGRQDEWLLGREGVVEMHRSHFSNADTFTEYQTFKYRMTQSTDPIPLVLLNSIEYKPLVWGSLDENYWDTIKLSPLELTEHLSMCQKCYTWLLVLGFNIGEILLILIPYSSLVYQPNI